MNQAQEEDKDWSENLRQTVLPYFEKFWAEDTFRRPYVSAPFRRPVKTQSTRASHVSVSAAPHAAGRGILTIFAVAVSGALFGAVSAAAYFAQMAQPPKLDARNKQAQQQRAAEAKTPPPAVKASKGTPGPGGSGERSSVRPEASRD